MRSRAVHKQTRILCTLIRPAFRFVFRLVPEPDPWERSEVGLNLPVFGSSDFRTYFLQPSTVHVSSLDEACEWLLSCEYHNDPDHFSDRNAWPPPSDFESCRRGDCKGHALWAWRKLNELGIVAELVCGQPRWDKEEFQSFSTTDVFFQGHAWVQFNRNGAEYLFDPSLKDRVCMVRPFTDVRSYYQPWFAVGSDFRRYIYWGHVVFLFA